MLLTKQEKSELLQKYYSEKGMNADQLFGIDVKTFEIINNFLEEIKSVTKSESLYRTQALKNSKTRLDKYEKIYSKYIDKVRKEDKLIFSKLINYITSEGGNIKSYNGDSASNMPMYISYKIAYKKDFIAGIHKSDVYKCESSLMGSLLRTASEKYYNKEEHQNIYEVEKILKIEAYCSYAVCFDIENLDVLKEQVSEILNNDYFKNWNFAGQRDEYENEILGYIYEAKREVYYHEQVDVEVYDGVRLDTCRYIACLVGFVRYGSFDRVKTLEEKNELYNKIYPYIYEMIALKDRHIFAKLANYLVFENDNYFVSGYNGFLNSSKKEILDRLTLFKTVEDACDNAGKKVKPKKYDFEIKPNVVPFSHMFTGGSAIFPTKGWSSCGQDLLKYILESDEFINWRFEGLKKPEEENHVLTYHDPLTELNFSENSYYLLGRLIRRIHYKESLSAKMKLKKQLAPIVLNYIPLKERQLFNTLLDYFTNEDESGINIDSRFVCIETSLISKKNGYVAGRCYTYNINKYSDVSKTKLVKSINHNVFLEEDVTEENLMEFFELKHSIEIDAFPANIMTHSEHYSRKYKNYNTILLALNSIQQKEELPEDDTQTNGDNVVENNILLSNDCDVSAKNSKETLVSYNEDNAECNVDDEQAHSLFDILELMSNAENETADSGVIEVDIDNSINEQQDDYKEPCIEQNFENKEINNLLDMLEFITNNEQEVGDQNNTKSKDNVEKTIVNSSEIEEEESSDDSSVIQIVEYTKNKNNSSNDSEDDVNVEGQLLFLI